METALSFGKPILVAGATEDKIEVGARVSWSGTGLFIKKTNPSSLDIQKAIERIFSSKVYKINAKKMQTEFSRYDGVANATKEINLFLSKLPVQQHKTNIKIESLVGMGK